MSVLLGAANSMSPCCACSASCSACSAGAVSGAVTTNLHSMTGIMFMLVEPSG